ncbi:MAG: hypothetical protein ACRDEA_00375, partial [Microcystaceae cyanobacterium]
MHRRLLVVIVLVFIGFVTSLSLASVTSLPIIAQASTARTIVQRQIDAVQQEEQGRQRYETGQFSLALKDWQAAAQAYQQQGDVISQARVLSNL